MSAHHNEHASTPLECVLASLKSLKVNLQAIQDELTTVRARISLQALRVQRTIQALEDNKWPPATPPSETNSSSA